MDGVRRFRAVGLVSDTGSENGKDMLTSAFILLFVCVEEPPDASLRLAFYLRELVKGRELELRFCHGTVRYWLTFKQRCSNFNSCTKLCT
jgi:hypothetical protein